MKKLSFLLIVSAISFAANAQSHWGTSPILPTWTAGNVGIGETGTPTNVRLQINNKVGSIAGGGYEPEIQINRTSGPVPFGSTVPNIFEIWKTTWPVTTNVRIDVIDPSGHLGILTATPAAPLDVNGNAIIRTNATVGNDLYVQGGDVDLSMPTDGTWRTVQAHTTTAGLNMIANTATTGPFVAMYAELCPPVSGENRAGQIFYNAYGVKGCGHRFLNYDGTTYHTNLSISNIGQTIIGRDTYVSDIVGGDVLTVKDQLGFYSANANSARIIDGNAPGGILSIQENTSGNDGPAIALHGKDYPPLSTGEHREGQVWYTAYGSTGFGHMFLNYNPSGTPYPYTPTMGIENDGKVVIGIDLIWGGSPKTPDGYLLYVEKGILTEKLKVANYGDAYNWSDFVFNKNYHLMPLCEVESYVKANKHLPEIPSASEVAKDGIDVASMDAKLLQKIEELTLYVIAQQKEIDELKQQKK